MGIEQIVSFYHLKIFTYLSRNKTAKNINLLVFKRTDKPTNKFSKILLSLLQFCLKYLKICLHFDYF